MDHRELEQLLHDVWLRVTRREKATCPRAGSTRTSVVLAWAPPRRRPRRTLTDSRHMAQLVAEAGRPSRRRSLSRLLSHVPPRRLWRVAQLLPIRPAGIPARPPWTGTLGHLARGETHPVH